VAEVDLVNLEPYSNHLKGFVPLAANEKSKGKDAPTQKDQFLAQVKKDALWKPLLRQFRRFIKIRAIKNYGKTMKNMFHYNEKEAKSHDEDLSDEDRSIEFDF
jgi:hypothetical protein